MNAPFKSRATRREFLWRFGGGLGGIALAHLLGEQRLLGGLHSISGSAIPGMLTASCIIRPRPNASFSFS